MTIASTTPHRSTVAAASPEGASFLEALAAACALMAHADGEMASAERHRIVSLLGETPALRSVPRERFVDEVATHEANFRLDPEVAQVLAREKLEPMRQDRRMAQRIVTVCRELIPADGVAHPSEYRALRDIVDYLKSE